MAKCYYCDTEIKNLPYRCKFCGMIFCKNHRLPENHNCPFDLIQKLKIEENSKSNLIYQDALEFMNKGLDIAKIYDYVTIKKLNKNQATNLLNFFIESSDQIEVRKNSILAFEVLELKNDEAFQILQNCLLSDESPAIRNLTAKVLNVNFPKKSKSLLKWAREKDKELQF